jgi:hypothetical protein
MLDYELWLLDDRGTRLALLNPISFQCLRVVNGVGAFQVQAHFDFDEKLLAVDRWLEVWRGQTDGALQLEFAGLVRKWSIATDDDGATKIEIEGEDTNGLLRRRVVAALSTTAQADKSGPGDDIIKAFVRENMGALCADATRDLSAHGLSVDEDLGLAPTVTIAASYWVLLDALLDIVADSCYQGTQLYFDMVPLSAAQMRFQTFIGQRGADRSWPNGNPPLVFGLEFGNLGQPKLDHDYSEEWNYVYSLGKGENMHRSHAGWGDEPRMAASVYNRVEHVHESQQTQTANLLNIAHRVAYVGRPLISFVGVIQDSDSSRYGRDWRFGDRVTATYHGRQFDALIASVRVGRTSEAEEILEVGLQWLT